MNMSSRQQRIVIIGNGMVGHHFVEQLINSEHNCHITVLSGESRLAYDRVYLSSYFSGKTAADLALTDEQTYQDWGVNAVTNAWVTDIDREKQVVTTKPNMRLVIKMSLSHAPNHAVSVLKAFEKISEDDSKIKRSRKYLRCYALYVAKHDLQ